MPLPLGTALSHPLTPATAAHQLVQQQSHHPSAGNTIQNTASNFRYIDTAASSQESALSCTTTTPGNIQSMLGITPGYNSQQQQPSANHLNIVNSSTNNNFSGGGNINSLAVGGRSSANHPAGNISHR